MKKVSLYVLAGLMAGGVSAKVDSGFYAGVGVSMNNNKYKHNVVTTDNNLVLDAESFSNKFSKNTVMPEIFVGYLCVGKSFAWAPELHVGNDFGKRDSYNLANDAVDLYQTTEVKKRLNLGLDMKLGRIVEDSAFVYGVLGLDLSRYKVSYRQDEVDAAGAVDSTRTFSPSAKFVPGLKVGAGADVYTNQNLFIGGEVNYTFRSKSIKSNNQAENLGMDQNVNNKLRPKNSLAVKVKIGWKF
ncbi:MAG: hypothetical protein CMM87_02430 [Rickettsiales bacterium]|nr:hypothetical protein [Rickettsiales bacterium]|tara:strand:+ start:170 stop:895 length:726 start_codon:yes stop_codon:yes gene_type:complete